MNRYFNSEEACAIYDELKPSVLKIMSCVNDHDFSGSSKAQDELTKIFCQLKGDKNSTEEYLNDVYVLNQFVNFISLYSDLWEAVIKGRFSESWDVLQNALDSMRCMKKFSKLDLSYFEDQLTEIEKTYPYKIFFSIGATVEMFECSICALDIDSSNCCHRKGELYGGKMAIAIARNISQLEHVAMVSIPEDKRCVIIYDDKGEQFKLIRYLSDLVKRGRFFISDFKGLSFSVVKKNNPDFVKQNRNEKCNCGSGKKFKKCCVSSQYIDGDHVDIVAEPFCLEHTIA